MSFAEMSIDETPDDEHLVTGFSGFSLSDQDVRNRQLLQHHQPPPQQQPFDDLTSEFSNLRASEINLKKKQKNIRKKQQRCVKTNDCEIEE